MPRRIIMPDPKQDQQASNTGTWQLTGNEHHGAWTIHDAEDNLVIICYCALPIARLLCAALDLWEALDELTGGVGDFYFNGTKERLAIAYAQAQKVLDASGH